MTEKDRDKVSRALRNLGPGFEIVRELGRGTTAIVYLVRDHELDRDLAVKVIRSTFVHDEEAVARLKREARLVAKLQHPNIVRIFGARQLPDGSLAVLMEHVPGRNVKEVLRATGPFGPARTLDVLRDVASALAYAHRRRIVHRDVKPENIYLDEEVGAARLADFGIARPWDRDARLTVPGEALGTPAYMSPEQIDGHDVDARTDVYSLGLVGYEMLAGEHPWEGDNLFNIIFKQKNEEPPPLRAARPGLPRELVDVLERALQKDRKARWESADALLERLDALRLADVESGSAGPWSPRTGTTAMGAAGAGAPSRGPVTPDTPGELAAPDRSTPGPSHVVGRGAHVPEAREPTTTAAEEHGGWRMRRLAVAAGTLALVALVAWSWTAWAGSDGEGWISRSEAEPGVRAGSDPAPPAGEPGPEPGSPEAAEPGGALEVVDDQVPDGGTVGTSVPLVFRVSTAQPDPRVRLRVVEGGGVLDPEVVDPGPDGVVRATLRLPERSGMVIVAASLDGTEGSEARVALAATPGPAQRVQPIVGESQAGDPGALLPEALGVRVVDALGNPIRDTEVRFQVLTGDGSVQPPRVRTDSVGRAFARWRLGPLPGEQSVAALVPAAEQATVVFEGTAQGLPATPEPTADPGEPGTGEPGPDSVGDLPAPGDEAPVGSATVVPRPLAVGGTHVCVLGGQGIATCPGALGSVRSDAANPVRFTALASGVRHACGLDGAGRAFCWGANDAGQLGDGTRTGRDAPTPVETSTAFSRLALGLSHSCALDAEGRVHCWGRNLNGQLGDGSRDDHTTPRPVTGSGGMVEIVAGWNHTCALAAEGRARCWGLNSDGQLGDGTRADRVTPTPVSGSTTFSTLSTLAAGSAHTCGLGGGAVYCWGADGSGQLGVGGASARAEPVRLESLPGTVEDVVAGAVHTCALVAGGDAWCWGQNIHGQLGDGSTTDRRLPVAVSGGLSFRTLEAGGGSTCGITESGERYCWGLNQSGQLGDGSRVNRSVPTRVGG